MARPVRIEYPGAYYYLSSSGVESEFIFKGSKDRQDFLSILQEVVQRMRWELYAYNLLPDSYQLFIKTRNANLSKGMRQLNGIYTQRYNAKHVATGHIFHGRFKAVLVEAEHSYDAVVQHILSMPLQKHKSRQLDKWKWSSYQASIGIINSPDWLNTNDVLSRLAKQKKKAKKNLIKKVAAYDRDYDLMKQVKSQILLGSEKFVNKWQKQLLSGKIMDKARQRKATPVTPLGSFAERYKEPKTAMVKAYGTGKYTLEQIGSHFNVHYSTVSRVVKKAAAVPNQ